MAWQGGSIQKGKPGRPGDVSAATGGSEGVSSPVTQVPLHRLGWDTPGRRVLPQQCREPQAPCQERQSCQDLAGPLQCPGSGGVSVLGPAMHGSSRGWVGRAGWPGQMAVAGWDVNCIVHQQLTAASVCPHWQRDVAVRHSRAGGLRGVTGCCSLWGAQERSQNSETVPQVTQAAWGPPPPGCPPDISLCPPDVPCSPRFSLLYPPTS